MDGVPTSSGQVLHHNNTTNNSHIIYRMIYIAKAIIVVGVYASGSYLL